MFIMLPDACVPGLARENCESINPEQALILRPD